MQQLLLPGQELPVLFLLHYTHLVLPLQSEASVSECVLRLIDTGGK